MMQHLFVYGTLAPGRPNAHILADVEGSWRPATLRGHLHAEGWGAAMGFPGMVLDPEGETIDGLVFSSEQLDRHWARLDAFEGEEYQRVVTDARLDDGRGLDVHVYVIRSRRGGGEADR